MVKLKGYYPNYVFLMKFTYKAFSCDSFNIHISNFGSHYPIFMVRHPEMWSKIQEYAVYNFYSLLKGET